MLAPFLPLLISLGLGPQEPSPAEALRAAVELSSATEREAAARTLAARGDVTLDEWLTLMQAFAPTPTWEPGLHQETVSIRIEGAGEESQVEETPITIHVPPDYDPARPAPLLVVLHGTGGSGRGLAGGWRPAADPLGMIVVAPSDPGENAGYGYTERERRTTLGALRWARLNFNVDEDRIHLTGASRGGHLAWDLALRNPDRFASLNPMIGGPRLRIDGGQNNLRYLENVVQLSIRDLQGAQDHPLLLANLRLAFERLEKWKAPDAELIEFPELGHDFELEAVDWRSFFPSAVRNPVPENVVRCAARDGEGRAFWVEVLETTKDVEEVFQPRVSAARYNSASEAKKQAIIQKLVDEKTARLEVTRSSETTFIAKGTSVSRFRLLLPMEWIPESGKLRVRFGSKSVRPKVEADALVLLREFVERFDRRFLPVAEVIVP